MTRHNQKPLGQSYNDRYRSGDAHWENAPDRAVLIAALQRCSDSDRALSLLDVGCGAGSFLERLRIEVSERWEYRGFYMARAAIEAGCGHHPHLLLVATDSMSPPAPDASFGIMTCYGSWEHFAQPQEVIAEDSRLWQRRQRRQHPTLRDRVCRPSAAQCRRKSVREAHLK